MVNKAVKALEKKKTKNVAVINAERNLFSNPFLVFLKQTEDAPLSSETYSFINLPNKVIIDRKL